MSKINNSELSSLLKKYGSSANGLSNKSVIENKNKFGSNVLDKNKKVTFLHRFFMQFNNLMIIILMLSAGFSLFVAIKNKVFSDLLEGIIILFIVILNAFVGALQEKKAENTLELLQKQTSTKHKIKRNGKIEIIGIDDIVVGDIIELNVGDIIPADIMLIETNDFYCNESTLTGESKPKLKDASSIYNQNLSISDQKCMCYRGTSVTKGNAQGLIISSGKNTEIGKIAGLISTKIKQKTPLEKNIDKIGKVITIAVSLIAILIFVCQLIFSNKVDFTDAFMTAIALAVAAIPESLPAVITIIMALGVQNLAKHNTIIKTLKSVETLGCCDCICTDKTGTLTQNQMSVEHVYTNSQLISKNDFESNLNLLQNTFLVSSLCSNAKIIDNNIIGDATEKALIQMCTQNSYNVDEIRNNCKRIKEYPFSSATKMMITINSDSEKNTAYIKGAFDYLIPHCSNIKLNGNIIPLNQSKRKEILKIHKAMTQNAERVIMLAEKQNVSPSDTDICENITFVALIGIIDPPRPEVYNAINECLSAGLKPIMITGDHELTALAIAKQLNIAKSTSNILTGKQIDNLNDENLAKSVSKFTVFARVTPEHKLRIVKALKQNGSIVAMTGDGVNDAPSIKHADIGICMGSGTDVTKSVADAIITDDNFTTIVLAVSQGRTIYQNIQKTLQFLISTNAVEVIGLFFVSLLMHDSIFLIPSQILFINLITDSLPAFALGIEPPEKDIMKKSPRPPSESIFAGETGTAIIYQAFIQSLVVLVLFVCSYHCFGNEIATTMTFITICLMQILHAVNCKTNKSIFKINILKNKLFNVSFILLFALIMLVSTIHPLQQVFSLVPLSLAQWIIVLASSISIIPLVELFKIFLNHKSIHSK